MKETIFCLVICALGGAPFFIFGVLCGMVFTFFMGGGTKMFVLSSVIFAVALLVVLLVQGFIEDTRNKNLLVK